MFCSGFFGKQKEESCIREQSFVEPEITEKSETIQDSQRLLRLLCSPTVLLTTGMVTTVAAAKNGENYMGATFIRFMKTYQYIIRKMTFLASPPSCRHR